MHPDVEAPATITLSQSASSRRPRSSVSKNAEA
jgi:hypothetical protein